MRDIRIIALSRTTIRVTDRDGVSVVGVSGDIDLISGGPLFSVLAAELDRRPSGVVVDLSGTVFFCTAGINALVDAAQRAGDRGVEMVVVAGHRVVLRPLRITGVDGGLVIEPSVDLALAALRADRATSVA